jgi:hypothetical protein
MAAASGGTDESEGFLREEAGAAQVGSRRKELQLDSSHQAAAALKKEAALAEPVQGEWPKRARAGEGGAAVGSGAVTASTREASSSSSASPPPSEGSTELSSPSCRRSLV